MQAGNRVTTKHGKGIITEVLNRYVTVNIKGIKKVYIKREISLVEIEVSCPICGNWHYIPESDYMPGAEYDCIECFYEKSRFQDSYIE